MLLGCSDTGEKKLPWLAHVIKTQSPDVSTILHACISSLKFIFLGIDLAWIRHSDFVHH